ncbi:MAG: protoheme IX farnesyltransferase [Alphaproteobacteria bacterium]|nr:protoheme IX farnesyltransferase [Alphaproteobacteria bacterium]
MSDASVSLALGGVVGRPAEPAVGDYIALLKPRVMILVLFTAFVGLMLAPMPVHPVIGFVALLCIAVGAGAAGAINMWYDADIDARMSRTAGRPIPAGRLAARDALGFGVTLAVGAVVLMGLLVNLAAASLLALSIGFYVLVYTVWLKRRTPQNIVIGGAAGALPPMVGWAAATGDIGLGAVVLFAIIFLWTPPHFWALALNCAADYARVGVPMLPVVSGRTETRRQIVRYSWLMVTATLLPAAVGLASPLYLAVALGLGGGFLVLAHRLRGAADGDRTAPRRLFGYSILYLFLLFAGLLADRLLGFGLA